MSLKLIEIELKLIMLKESNKGILKVLMIKNSLFKEIA